MTYRAKVLMSILPGIREFRVPLASGLIWMLTAWLTLEPILAVEDPPEALARLYRLGDFFGPAGATAAALFVAYLVGIILAFYRIPMRLRTGSSPSLAPGALGQATVLDLRNFVADIVHEAQEYLVAHGKLRDAPWTEESEADVRQAIRNTLMAGLVQEERTLAMRLRIAEKGATVYQSYDAKYAEAQFRQGVAFPITALISALSFIASAWWLVSLVVPASLFVLAYYAHREATAELCQAVIHKLIPSTTIGMLASAIQEQDLEQLLGHLGSEFLLRYVPNEVVAEVVRQLAPRHAGQN